MSSSGLPTLRHVTVVALALLALSVASCGSGDSQSTAASVASEATPTTTEPAPPTAEEVKATAGDLLDSWTTTLVPILLVARDRAQASQAGETDKASRLERTLMRELKPVTRWGRDARRAFIESDPNKLTRTTTRAGDGWAKWALMLRESTGLNYDEAAKVADVATEALRQTQRAYRLAGRPIPPAFQNR